MAMEYVYKDVDRLETPVGYFQVLENGKPIPFSVIRNDGTKPAQARGGKGQKAVDPFGGWDDQSGSGDPYGGWDDPMGGGALEALLMGDQPLPQREPSGHAASISTDDNYQIILSSEALDPAKGYEISFSAGSWEYCSAGEHTSCFDTVIDGWVVGIGACDPNDQQKNDQLWDHMVANGFVAAPSRYDEKRFRKYTIEQKKDYNGFYFKLYDRTEEYVRFEVAWVKVVDHDPAVYETALGFWLC